MKRILSSVLVAVLVLAQTSAWADPFAWGSSYQGSKPTAANIKADTSNFAGNLSATDTTVQAALDTLDNLSVSGAPTDAKYITQTANGSLSAEQALSSLSTGIMRVATTTGVITSLTDSAGIAANISDESGTGVMAFTTSPVFTTPNIGSATGSISGNAGTVTTADASGDTTTFPMLAIDATGSLAPATDAGLSYNATSNALTATTFVGALTGNASTVTTADAGSDTTTWVLLGNAQTGSQAPASDAGLTYNSSTDALTATTFIGALTGNASTVTTNANLTGEVTSSGNATTIADSITVTGWVLGTSTATTFTTTNFGATTATGSMTLAENSSIALDPAGSADGKYTGITVTGTGGATIAFGDLVTLDKDDSRWELVDISVAAAATGDARGILGMAVTSSTDGGALTVLLQGIIRADANFPALTIGAEVFATTAGDIVVTQPTTTDYVIRRVGSALTADEIYFDPDHSWYTHT